MTKTQKVSIIFAMVLILVAIYEIATPTKMPNVAQVKTQSSAQAKLQSSTTVKKTNVSIKNKSKYVDGTYSGVGNGKNGPIKVNVTIVGDKITKIAIVSYHDNAEYYNQAAATVPQNIINKQTANVDGVSGATLSSDGIKSAVANALAKALSK